MLNFLDSLSKSLPFIVDVCIVDELFYAVTCILQELLP